MQLSDDNAVCVCPPIIPPPCPPSCPPPSSAASARYYQEIGAEMIDNRLIIKLERDRGNRRKRRREEQWEPPCDCVEIQRPTAKRGARIINAECDDRVVFRVKSTSRFGREEAAYKSQTIAYKMGPCEDEPGGHRCETVTVYPQGLGIPATQEVYSSHVTANGQDIFLLKIKKRAEDSEQRDRNVELELRTPTAPKQTAVELPAIESPAIEQPSAIKPVAIAPSVAESITKEAKESDTAEQPERTRPRRVRRRKK